MFFYVLLFFAKLPVHYQLLKDFHVSCSLSWTDEDFACSKAPPSKKPKEEMRHEQKKSISRSSSQETNPKLVQIEKSRWAKQNETFHSLLLQICINVAMC